MLEWSDTDKGMVPVVFLILTNSQYLLWCYYAGQRADAAELLNLDALHALQAQVAAITVGAAVLLGLGALLRRRFPHLVAYQLVTAVYFGLTLVACSHYVGTLAISAGVVLLGAPLFGFIVLNRFVVWVAFSSSLITLVTLSMLSAQGVIPYAPMVRASASGEAALFWAISEWCFAAPHIILVVLVADRVLSWWRKREQMIEQMSRTDALTGIRNRRSVMDALAREWARSVRHGTPLSLALLDLDHFKRVNDTWGHPAGDAVLVAAAKQLRASVRECDVLGRYGGEEFMLVLPDTPTAGAEALLERCRVALTELGVHAAGGEAIPVSGSFGLVCVEGAGVGRDNLTIEHLIKAADEGLYRAKEGGRNRVEAVTLADSPPV